MNPRSIYESSTMLEAFRYNKETTNDITLPEDKFDQFVTIVINAEDQAQYRTTVKKGVITRLIRNWPMLHKRIMETAAEPGTLQSIEVVMPLKLGDMMPMDFSYCMLLPGKHREAPNMNTLLSIPFIDLLGMAEYFELYIVVQRVLNHIAHNGDRLVECITTMVNRYIPGDQGWNAMYDFLYGRRTVCHTVLRRALRNLQSTNQAISGIPSWRRIPKFAVRRKLTEIHMIEIEEVSDDDWD